MLRKSCVCRIVFCLLAGLGSGYSGWAQDSNRGDNRGERYFKEMDRDKDGTLTEEEYNRADDGRRELLKESGLGYRPGMTLEMFSQSADKLEEVRDKLRERERENRGDGDRGNSDRGGSDRGSSSSRSKPKEKVKINVALPANYVPMDKNGDGQIGLYEWERAKFAEFRGLDRNGDGFLSPKELVTTTTVAAGTKPGTSTRPVSRTSAPAVVAPPVAPQGQPSTSTTVKPAAPAVVVATPPEEDKETKAAKFMFGIVDKNKDGAISQEEWTDSRGARVKFEQANITPSLPLSEADFVKQYRALEQKKTT